jgi:uncharacterized protein YkwD
MCRRAILKVRLAILLVALVSPVAASSGTLYYSRGRDTSARLLAMHNVERARMNIAPLQWDPQLAAAAASYGPALARLGFLQHSPRQLRPGQRENLWMGTRGAYSPEQMVGSWIAEKREFRPGVFPNVSSTGHWEDVAHYTQVIARETTRVGCAIQPTGQFEFLICRYSPPGNIDGRRLP